MENEKMEVMETVIENENNDVQVYYEEPTSEGGGFGKVLLAIGGLAVAGTAAYLVKTKEKRKEKKLRKAAELLAEEGYEVFGPIEEDIVDGEAVEVETEEVSEPEEKPEIKDNK